MINIDLTTKNTVYNSLGAQAQWVQHRFGRRNYPDLELDTDTVKQLISQANDTVNLISVFGDPSEHANIIEIIDFIEPGKLIFNSYLNFDNDKSSNKREKRSSISWSSTVFLNLIYIEAPLVIYVSFWRHS
jgi:hypothetical protein